MVQKQFKLKLRPFEILAIKAGIVWASEMELIVALTAIDALLVFLHPSHTMPLYDARIPNVLSLTDAIFETGASGVLSKSQKSFVDLLGTPMHQFQK